MGSGVLDPRNNWKLSFGVLGDLGETGVSAD